MTVTRIHEAPRVTKPYTEEQWAEIDGARRPRRRATWWRGDVRLTHGRRADLRVDRRPRRRRMEHRRAGPDQARPARPTWCTGCAPSTAQGGLLHFGQGKWYPGEQLPRWALASSGAPTASRCGTTRRCSPTSARPTALHRATTRAASARALADDARARPERYVQPGYEDVWYYLWRERRLPVNVDPFDAQARRPDGARAAAPRVRAGPRQGRSATCCRSRAPSRRAGRARWQSGPWFLRDERMYLMPGDSPMGYRLPLDSLPWVAATALHDRRDPTDRARAAGAPTCERASGAAQTARRRRSRAGPTLGTPSMARAAQQAAGEPVDAAAQRQRARIGAGTRTARAWSRDRAAHGPAAERAQRRALRLHAAARRASRTTSSWSPRSRTRRAELEHAGHARRLPAAARPAPERCCRSRPTRA